MLRSPLIILEGPDGAGKTTLAKTKLADHMYLHFGPPPRGKDAAWWQYANALRTFWQTPDPRGVVFDRFVYGELIYGPLLRGKTDLTWAHVRMLERVLLGMGASLVVCLPPYEVILSSWARHKEAELIQDETKLWEVYVFYLKQVLGKAQLVPRRLHDYTTPDLSFVPPTQGFVNEGPGIGCFCPGNTLLVGEQVNTNKGFDAWPFVSGTGSSIWLAQYLDFYEVLEKDLYWVNSVTYGEETDPRFVDKLQPEQVICLGGKASQWATRHKLGHQALPHPQYHKRFHHHEPYGLAELLNPSSVAADAAG